MGADKRQPGNPNPSPHPEYDVLHMRYGHTQTRISCRRGNSRMPAAVLCCAVLCGMRHVARVVWGKQRLSSRQCPAKFFVTSLALCARRGGNPQQQKGQQQLLQQEQQQAAEELQRYHCQRTYIHYTLECSNGRAGASTGINIVRGDFIKHVHYSLRL